MELKVYFLYLHENINSRYNVFLVILMSLTLSGCISQAGVRPDSEGGLLGCRTAQFPDAMLVALLENGKQSDNFQRIAIERNNAVYDGGKNVRLERNDIIRTDGNTQALLLLKGCNALMLDHETVIRLVNPFHIIEILLGKLFSDVSKDADKHTVQDGQSGAATLGTEYLVKKYNERFTVSVYRGRVRLTSRQATNTSFIIPAGQQIVRFDNVRYGNLEPANMAELERARRLTDRLLNITVSTNGGSDANSIIPGLIGIGIFGAIVNSVLDNDDDNPPVLKEPAPNTNDIN